MGGQPPPLPPPWLRHCHQQQRVTRNNTNDRDQYVRIDMLITNITLKFQSDINVKTISHEINIRTRNATANHVIPKTNRRKKLLWIWCKNCGFWKPHRYASFARVRFAVLRHQLGKRILDGLVLTLLVCSRLSLSQ